MADNIEIDIDVNDNSGNRGGTPVDNSPGVSSQDENFAPLTGGGAQQSNRKGTPLGPDVYRPKGMESAPEFLNLLSILSSHFTLAREIFLPLRKVYQLHANTVKKEAQRQKKRERNDDFDEDEALINNPDKVEIRAPKTDEDFLKAGYRPYKRGQNLPWIDGKPQGRAGEGGAWVDPKTNKVHGKAYTRLEKFTQGFFEKISKPFMSGLNKYVVGPFKAGSKLIFNPIAKTSAKVWGGLNTAIMKNFLPLAGLAGGLVAVVATFQMVNAVLTSWAREWERFSPGVLAQKAIQNVKTMGAQIEAARRTDTVMSENVAVSGELERTMIDIKSTLVDSIMPIINAGLKLMKPVLDAVKIVVSLLGIVIKPIFAIVNLIADGIIFLLQPLAWGAEILQDLYDDVSEFISWATLGALDGDDDEDMKDILKPALGMFGATTAEMEAGAIGTLKARAALPGVVR